MNKLILSKDFLETYKNIQPNWGPLGYFTAKTKYARVIENENRTEEWWETCRRVVEGTYRLQQIHCQHLNLPWNGNKAQHSAREMYDLMFNLKWVPAGRGLWGMGTEYLFERHNSSILFNCSIVSTKDINQDFSEPFCYLMDMSMLGVGVSGTVDGAGNVRIKQPRVGNYTFVVEDSREGWVEITRVVLDAYAGKGALPEQVDYSQIRPLGAPIKGFGGTAPGPEPLIELIEKDIPRILNPLVDESVTSTAIADLFNVIGRCVVSGGIRRTAILLLGDINDKEFVSLKDPTIHSEEIRKFRYTSNNSIIGFNGADYSYVAELIKENGEPGTVWLENAKRYGRFIDGPIYFDDVVGSNPCSEIFLESGELCNVVEVMMSNHKTLDELIRTFKFAYLYAKSVTLPSTHNPKTNAIQLKNRRIGISLAGVTQNIAKQGYRNHFNWCEKGYKYIRHLDKVYSDWLCIPTSIKVTTAKPGGTTPLLSGCTSGIHYPKSEYYWRTKRFPANSEIVNALRENGYPVHETNEHNTVVLYFPVKEKNFTKSVKDVSMWEQLEIAAQTQYYWADNSVSTTVEFTKEESKDLVRALEMYETRLKSVSFLPKSDPVELMKKGFEHLPIQPISKEEYEDAVKKLRPVEDILRGMKTTETTGDEKVYCDSEKCEIIRR